MKKMSFLLGLLGLILGGCDSRTPREKFQDQLETMLNIALPASGIKSSKEVAKCSAKYMADSFSDEEIRLVTDSSFTDRLKNPQKVLALQQKMESPQFAMRYAQKCYEELSEAKNKNR